MLFFCIQVEHHFTCLFSNYATDTGMEVIMSGECTFSHVLINCVVFHLCVVYIILYYLYLLHANSIYFNT